MKETKPQRKSSTQKSNNMQKPIQSKNKDSGENQSIKIKKDEQGFNYIEIPVDFFSILWFLLVLFIIILFYDDLLLETLINERIEGTWILCIWIPSVAFFGFIAILLAYCRKYCKGFFNFLNSLIALTISAIVSAWSVNAFTLLSVYVLPCIKANDEWQRKYMMKLMTEEFLNKGLNNLLQISIIFFIVIINLSLLQVMINHMFNNTKKSKYIIICILFWIVTIFGLWFRHKIHDCIVDVVNCSGLSFNLFNLIFFILLWALIFFREKICYSLMKKLKY